MESYYCTIALHPYQPFVAIYEWSQHDGNGGADLSIWNWETKKKYVLFGFSLEEGVSKIRFVEDSGQVFLVFEFRGENDSWGRDHKVPAKVWSTPPPPKKLPSVESFKEYSCNIKSTVLNYSGVEADLAISRFSWKMLYYRTAKALKEKTTAPASPLGDGPVSVITNRTSTPTRVSSPSPRELAGISSLEYEVIDPPNL